MFGRRGGHRTEAGIRRTALSWTRVFLGRGSEGARPRGAEATREGDTEPGCVTGGAGRRSACLDLSSADPDGRRVHQGRRGHLSCQESGERPLGGAAWRIRLAWGRSWVSVGCPSFMTAVCGGHLLFTFGWF